MTTRIDASMILNLPAIVTTNVAGMVALESVKNGSVANLLGYYAPGDGGGGLFYFDSSSTEPEDSGFVFAPTSGTGRWIRLRDYGFANVMWFGAKGDGVTDDTLAIQRAANANLNLSFGDPSKSYKISSTITLRSGARLSLKGARVFQVTAQTPCFNIEGKVGINISGGTLEGATSFVNNPSGQDIGIKANNSEDVKISGVIFLNFGYAGYVCQAGGKNTNITNCTARGFADTLGPEDRNNMGFCLGGIGIKFKGNTIENTSQGLIVVEGSSRVSLTINIIDNIPIEHGMYVDTSVVDLEIIGNIVTNCEHIGIKVQWYDGGGTVNPRNILIANNIVRTCGDSGIVALNSQPGATPLFAIGLTIEGNNVFECGGEGIIARYALYMKITGNNVSVIAKSGISTDTCSGSITDNDISQVQLVGINSYGNFTYLDVIGNRLREVGLVGTANPGSAVGIVVAVGTNFRVIDNNILSSAYTLSYGMIIESATSTGSSVTHNTVRGYITAGIRLPDSRNPLDRFEGNVSYGTTTKNAVVNPPNGWQQGAGLVAVYSGSAIPTAPSDGLWNEGDRIVAPTPLPGQPAAWVCVGTGSPGSWRVLETVAP